MLISRILPSGVSCAEAFADPPAADAALFPEEEQLIARAVDKRRREFVTARNCARSALAGLGIAPVPIPRGQRGAPQWPPGVVGSITHCAGYRAAVVAWAADAASLGIDAEPNGDLPGGVLEAIALPGERARLPALAAAAPDLRWDRLLFSAKESVYKAWFPLTGRWLDFHEADIRIDPEAGTFVARLLVPGPRVGNSPVDVLAGRWLASGELILTAVVIPAPGAPSSGSL
jgi:4'-phosphopantetheinyl transferase EntD